MEAPDSCPMCGEKDGWVKVDEGNMGFSGGKALVGGILLGPVGLVAGVLGKKKAQFHCRNCGFSHEYTIKKQK